jgi:hypothetical protein
MTSFVQLVSDTSGGNWTDYTGPMVVLPSRGDLTTFGQNTHQEVFRFRAPAEWRANSQRAVLIGHICFRCPNFEGRRPWHVWAQGGLSVGSAGVCGCSHGQIPASTFPGGAHRNLAMDFMIDVRFTSNADTVVSCRMDSCGNYQLKNNVNTQSTLWIVPVDERTVQ